MKIQITIDPDLPVPFVLFELPGYGFLLGKNPGMVARMPTWLQETLLNLLCEDSGGGPGIEIEDDNVIHLADMRQWSEYLNRSVPAQRVEQQGLST